MAAAKILLVDDEQDILDLLSYNLGKEGYDIYTATDGLKGVEMADKVVPDLILIDVMMPALDGMEACAIIRGNPKLNNCLIAFLSARGEDYSQLAGFEAGADDYILKPVKPKVLLGKVKGLLRRSDAGKGNTTIPVKKGLFMDLERYLIVQNGKDIELPKKEFELLALLASKPGSVFSRSNIMSKVWGDLVVVGDRTIDVHIRKLREKFGSDLIHTVKGVGYKLTEF